MEACLLVRMEANLLMPTDGINSANFACNSQLFCQPMSIYAQNKLLESKTAFTLLLFSCVTFVTAITFKTKIESYKTLYLKGAQA